MRALAFHLTTLLRTGEADFGHGLRESHAQRKGHPMTKKNDHALKQHRKLPPSE